MKRIAVFLIAALLVGALAGQAFAQQRPVTGSENITMDSIDRYLMADNVRFVDFRNFDDAMRGGYLAGFEIVPFFDYLENRALVRHDGWNFTPRDIVDEAMLERLFGPKDRTLVGICQAGVRAEYVFAALSHLGWTTLINAGGFRDYTGPNRVAGDGTWRGVKALPVAGVNMDNIDGFLDRPAAKYVDFRNVADKYTDGWIDGFEVISFFEFLEDRAVVRHDGWNFRGTNVIDDFLLEDLFGAKDREIFLMCLSGARSGYVKQALESIGYENVHNVGGIRDYAGENRVFGDPSFSF